MLNKTSLRLRISVTFFLLAGLLSLLFAWAVSFTLERMEHGYIESMLNENLDLLIAEYQSDPRAPLPRTASITTYVSGKGATANLPGYLQFPEVGIYELDVGERELQIAVREVAGQQFILTYDTTALSDLDDRLELALAIGVAVFSLLALWLGNWTADRIIAPVTNLAAQLRASVDQVETANLRRQWGDDEVEELAVAFEGYMTKVRELMARERELTANVSHELRTPIMVASSSVELILSRTDLDETTRGQLARLQRAIRKMASLTDAFLILGREAVIQKTPGADSPVEPTLREVIEARREAAERKSLDLNLEVKGSPKVQAPKTAISVVLDNLLGNAVNYTDDGRVTVFLESDGVVISDTGPGIPPDERERVFEREYRGRGAAPGGAGLGLSIVRALCDHYGWRISLRAGTQGGTTASLRFSP